MIQKAFVLQFLVSPIQGPRAWLFPSHNGARVDLEQIAQVSTRIQLNLTVWDESHHLNQENY